MRRNGSRPRSLDAIAIGRMQDAGRDPGLGRGLMLWKHLAALSSVSLLAACQQPQPIAVPAA